MVKCKYCGDETSKRNAICNSCNAKLNAKRYLKEILNHYKPDEILSKRNLGIYLDKSLNVEIVLLTLYDFGLVKKRGPHGYRIATKDVINEFLSQNDLTLIEGKEKKYKIPSKSKVKTTETLKTEITENESVPLKKCKICGSDLPKNSKNDICRKCSKKIHAINVLEEIIPITGVGIPFNKDDLSNIYDNNSIKAQDTIWTLQDFNLVNNLDNNKFELVSEEKINQFFKENNNSNKVSDLISKTSKHVLQKTCLKCNKTLPISDFRKISDEEYSDYCKSCDKIIKTANYLVEFVNVVGFDEFKITDIKNIENIQGKIFNLQDNDLITFNGEYYQLVNQDKINSFINSNKEGNSQLENILDAFKTHNTMIEAAESVGVSNVEVTNFYIEGKNGNIEYVEFFNEINNIKKEKSQKIPCPKCKKTKGYDNGKCKNCGYININLLNLNDKMDFVLSFIEENNSVKAAKKLDIPYENVKLWDELGKSGIAPYTMFSEGIEKIKKESKSNAIKRNKISQIEERLNENLRKIQRTELFIDKNIIKLKNLELTNRKIKSEYDEIYDELQIMKNDLIFQKNEIRSIKEDLPKYSLNELNNVKSFTIKGTSSISLKIDKFLKEYDEYSEKDSAKSITKTIKKLEDLIDKITSELEVTDKNLSKLINIQFLESLKYDKNKLIYKLENYKLKLTQYHSYIEHNLSELKNNRNSNLKIVEIIFIDYSSEVDNLISENQKVKSETENRDKILNDKLIESNKKIEEINNYIKKLDSIDFSEPYKLDKIKLFDELTDYKSKLTTYKNKLFNLKYNYNLADLDNIEFNFIDYSSKVNELISKNQKTKIKNEPFDNSENFKKESSTNNEEGIVNKLFNRFNNDSSTKEPKNTSKISTEDKSSNKESQRKLVLKYYEETKDLKEAAKLANVPIFIVNSWYQSGKSGLKHCVDFYNGINKIKKP